MELEIGRAEQFYRDGAALLDWLAPPGQRLFGMMTATYRALLRKIARRPEEVFRRRIRLGRTKKLQIAARWACCRRASVRTEVTAMPLPAMTSHSVTPSPSSAADWPDSARGRGRRARLPRRTRSSRPLPRRPGRKLPRSRRRATRRHLPAPGPGLLHQPVVTGLLQAFCQRQ